MLSCKACGGQMPMDYIEGTDCLEFLCKGCKTKAQAAIEMDQYQFEGLWWDTNWPGYEHHVLKDMEVGVIRAKHGND